MVDVSFGRGGQQGALGRIANHPPRAAGMFGSDESGSGTTGRCRQRVAQVGFAGHVDRGAVELLAIGGSRFAAFDLRNSPRGSKPAPVTW